jgi:Tol biopolymer transport system component
MSSLKNEYCVRKKDGVVVIVFTSDLKGERHIWRMNIDGCNPIQLTNGTGEDNPYCSPDGRWVFYTILENAGANLLAIGRVSIDGGEMKQLTEAFTANPSVSPDGKLFACLHAEGPGPFPWNIAVYPVDGPVDGRRPTSDQNLFPAGPNKRFQVTAHAFLPR